MVKISKHGSRRRFSEGFKRKRVQEYEQGEITVREISRLYKVSIPAVYRWLHKYSYFYKNNLVIVEERESNSKGLEKAKQKIKNLEQLLGQKEIEIAYLTKLIEVVGEELQMDVKKTIGTKHLKDLD